MAFLKLLVSLLCKNSRIILLSQLNLSKRTEHHISSCTLILWFLDRKKDLVKLSNGEYISLGKVESIVKTCKYVENACVCADSSHSYPVALIVVAQPQVGTSAKIAQ